jgi:ribonuclease BN (tRNA processing enzyme)
MFHFEDRMGERSLATGDFRFCEAMLREPLLQRVDTLYLDSTFLDPQFSSFPTKEQSIQIGTPMHTFATDAAR